MPGDAEKGLAFVDTNVFVYAYDRQADERQLAARMLIQRLVDEDRMLLSAQVLNELAAVLLRRRGGSAVAIDQTAEIVEEVAALGRVVDVTEKMSIAALGAVRRHGLSFWDALIWAAAKEHGAASIFTEDFQHGRTLAGVAFRNPFLA